MRKYVSVALLLLITLTLVGAVNRLPVQLYSPGNVSVSPESIEQLMHLFNASNVPNVTPSQLFPWLNETPPNLTPRMFQGQPLDERNNLFNLRNINPNSLVMVVSGALHTSYLRNEVYDTYRDGKWYPVKTRLVRSPSRFLPSVPYTSRRDVISVKLMTPVENGFLYTSLYTFSVNGSRTLYSPETNLFYAENQTVEYTFTTVHYSFSPEELRKAGVPSDGNFTRYLQVPENISPAIISLARNVTRNATTPYEKALAIENYLMNNYVYSLNATPAPQGVDPVYWFLFKSKEGVCLDFNSAFVLLARLNGLPARLVTGFRIEPSAGMQAVYMRQAHAWAEVYFEGLGWVTFDATPAVVPSRPPEENVTLQNPNVSIAIAPSPVVTQVGSPSSVNVTVFAPGCEVRNVTVALAGQFNITKNASNGRPVRFELPAIEPPGEYHPTVRTALDCRNGTYHYSTRFTLIVNGAPFKITAPANLTAFPYEWIKIPVEVTGNGSHYVSVDAETPGPKRIVDGSGWVPMIAVIETRAPLWVGEYIINVTASDGRYSTLAQIALKVVDKTETRITELPSEIDIGKPFLVKGVVYGKNNQPASGPVVITLNKTKFEKGIVIGRGTVVNGTFAVNCSLPTSVYPGEYQIVAHYLGNGFFLPSNSDPAVLVKIGTVMTGPSTLVSRPGTVNVTGRLTYFNGTPIGNAEIIVHLDRKFYGTTRTGPDGYFTTNVSVFGYGKHNLTLIYLGGPTVASAVKHVDVFVVSLNATVPRKWVVLSNVTVNGTLHGSEFGDSLTMVVAGESVNIPLEWNGNFSKTLKVTQKPGTYTVTFLYRGQPVGTYTVTVVSPTNISVVAGKMKRFKSGEIRVRLVDVFGDPVPNARLVLDLFGKHEAVTNSTGWAIFRVTPDSGGTFTGKVAFAGNALYLPSEAEFKVSVSGFSSVIYTLFLVPVGIAGLIAYRERERIVTRVKKTRKTRSSGIRLDREPPVYGVGEKIRVTLAGPAELLVDGKPFGTGTEFELELPKGVHTLSAGRLGRARVWVVDYGEEVIRLYNDCFLRFAGRFADVRNLTPEELAEVLSERFPERAESLKKVTWIFEVARYSPRLIGKGEFEEFYSSLRDAVGGDCYE